MNFSSIRTFIKNNLLEKIQYLKYTRIYKMDIDETVRMSSKAILDKTNPKGVHIGEYTMITANVAILTHDFINATHTDTYVGKNCFIGMNSIILAGKRVGDNVIIAAGSVITKDVPSNCIVGGNPATIIKKDVTICKYGQIPKENETC